jgi:hypothetical protein
LQHIGDVLATIMTDLDEQQSTVSSKPPAREMVPVSVPVTVPAMPAQGTFAFYQPAEV